MYDPDAVIVGKIASGKSLSLTGDVESARIYVYTAQQHRPENETCKGCGVSWY